MAISLLIAIGACQATAAEIAKVPVVIPMVRIEVSTPNPAVNETYELEIDSCDGQNLRGFEPEQAAGELRALISIDMASVRSLAFFQRTVERELPSADRTQPGAVHDPDTPGPTDAVPETRENKELARRFEHLIRDAGEAQLSRIFETLKSPEEYRQLTAHLQNKLTTADTPETLQQAVRALTLVEYLHNCTEAARQFEQTTSAQYFSQIPQFLREAQMETAQAVRQIPQEENRKEADKLLYAQDLKMVSKPLAERVWNQTVPENRRVLPSPRRFGNGPKPFKNPRAARPTE